VAIELEGIVVIVGNYGSGKTEVSINLALHRRAAGIDICVADLDLVNPYFRAREARGLLTERGIKVALPPEVYLQADLPILSPVVAGIIRNPARLTILDVGGDDVGATVLSALADSFQGRCVRVLQVVNPFRPFTDTVEGCMHVAARIEAASRLSINGIVGNANILDETQPEDIYTGHAFCRKLAAASGLPLEFITAASDMLPRLELDRFKCPVLPVARQLVPPWRRAAALMPGAP
jgi:hypothetical protein